MAQKPKIQTVARPKGKIVDIEEKETKLYIYFESFEAKEEWMKFITAIRRKQGK